MNPEVMKMAMEQMARMTPQQMAEMQRQASSMSPDMMQAQMAQMNSLNPEQIRLAQSRMAGMTPEQVQAAGAQARTHFEGSIDYKVTAATRLKSEGNALHSKKDWAAAAEKYRLAKENVQGMNSPAAKDLHRACMLNLSSCSLNSGDYAGCASVCSEVLQADAANRKALFRRGQALSKLGLFALAVPDLEKALELSPTDEKPVIQEKLDAARIGLENAPGSASVETSSAAAAATATSVPETVVSRSAPAPAAVVPPAQPRAAAVAPRAQPAGQNPAAAAVKPEMLRQVADMMQADPSMMQTMASAVGGMSQADLDRMATMNGMPAVSKDVVQQSMAQMSKMRPEDIDMMARQAEAGTLPGLGGGLPPGMDSEHFKKTAEMFQSNPEMMKQAAAMMQSMPPEQLEAMARASGVPMAAGATPQAFREAAQAVQQMRPEDLQSIAQQAAAAAQAGSAGGSTAPVESASRPAERAPQYQPPASSSAVAASAAPLGPGGMQISPDMIKMATGMMANMTPEDMQKMAEMAQGMGGPGGPGMGAGGAPSPEMMAKMQKSMADPAMMGMMKNFMSSMSPQDLAAMMAQQGVQVTPEEAEVMQKKLENLSPTAMKLLVTAGTAAQRAAEATRTIREWLSANPAVLYAIVFLVLALLARWFGLV